MSHLDHTAFVNSRRDERRLGHQMIRDLSQARLAACILCYPSSVDFRDDHFIKGLGETCSVENCIGDIGACKVNVL